MTNGSTSPSLKPPPSPTPDLIVTVRHEAYNKGYTVELPFGPVYFFEEGKDMYDFVCTYLKKYAE